MRATDSSGPGDLENWLQLLFAEFEGQFVVSHQSNYNCIQDIMVSGEARLFDS